MLQIQNTRVGYQQTRVVRKPSPESAGENDARVKIIGKQYLVLKRFEESSEQTLDTECIETADGSLVEFESREAMGRELSITRGKVDGNRLHLETVTGDKRDRTSIDWPEGSGGWYAVDHSLRGQPMQPGEKRQLTSLTPVINRIAEVSLEARDYETTEVAGESRKLLKVIRKDRIAGANLESVLWVDERGESLKSRVAGIGLETHRCSRAEALSLGRRTPLANRNGTTENGNFDIGTSSVVRLQKPIGNPHDAKKISYRVWLEDSAPAEVFASTSSQSVVPLGSDQATITVIALRPDTPTERKGTSPNDDDLAPNNWIQSDDPAIVNMAREAVGAEKDPWKIACILERLVRSKVRSKNFTQAFLSAAEVARSGEGDCTEHAVLLAALCRAQRIPARVAIGLVYFAPLEGFAYHMWNEAWIGDRWIPLDGTLGLGGIGCGHLQLASSNLKGSDSRAVFLPVSQVMGRLKLEIRED